MSEPIDGLEEKKLRAIEPINGGGGPVLHRGHSNGLGAGATPPALTTGG